jgi:hypothetical protein
MDTDYAVPRLARLAALGALLASGLAGGLAGCGLGGHPGATGTPPSPSPSVDVMALAHQFVVCARAHGMPNLPEPTLGSDGRPHFPNEASLPKQPPQSVLAACRSIMDQIDAAQRQQDSHDGGYQPKPADVPKLIQYAQCMRTHGFPNWPDPLADGTFPGAGMPHQKTPALLSAMDACAKYNPDPRGGVHGH